MRALVSLSTPTTEIVGLATVSGLGERTGASSKAPQEPPPQRFLFGLPSTLLLLRFLGLELSLVTFDLGLDRFSLFPRLRLRLLLRACRVGSLCDMSLFLVLRRLFGRLPLSHVLFSTLFAAFGGG